MADRKEAYAASSNLTVNNGLEGLAYSATWVAGWESDAIDNTTNKYLDYLISGKIQVYNSSAVTAADIRIYVVAMMDDSTWPDVFDGTGSAETVSTTAIRDQVCKLGAVIPAATTQGAIYNFGPFSVANLFGGSCPAKFVIFITHATGQNLHTTGQQVTIKGVYETVA